MARGKKAAGAARRRASQDDAIRMSLIAEIQRELDLTAAAREAAGLVAALDERAAAASRRRDRAVAPEIAQLMEEIALWERLRTGCLDLDQRASDLNLRWVSLAQRFFGGGHAGLERVMAALGLKGLLQSEESRRGTLPVSSVLAIDRARGVRHRPEQDYQLDAGLGRMLPEHLIEDALAAGLTGATKRSEVEGELVPVFMAANARVLAVTSLPPTTLNPTALPLWRPSPLRALLPAAVAGQLGVPAAPLVGALAVPPDPIPAPSAALSLTGRQQIAATVTPGALLKAWAPEAQWAAALGARFRRFETSLGRRPRVGRPVDAALLRSHYFLAGIGQLLREGGQSVTSGLAEVTVGCGAASPHWLPPGQTVSFLDGDPMPEESRDDLRLPFPQVFVAFSDPLRIPPDPAAPQPEITRALSKVAIGLRESKDCDVALDELAPYYDTLPEIIDYHGAWVEGLVLLSDSLGRPLDTVGWCIAVVPNPGVTIARMLVPASREACLIPGVIDSVEAILSWAGWDAPDTAAVPVTPSADLIRAILDDPKVDQDSYRTDLGRVHVLNVRRTHVGSGDGDGTGASVAPHLRRGHWRRQRVGVGRAEVRWVRVAATAVNAGKGALTPQVYRLPSAASAKPALADSA